MRKRYYVKKKYHWNHAITIAEISKQFFAQQLLSSLVNSTDSSNANFKKQRESVTYRIRNKTKNTNDNLAIEGLMNLRKFYTNNLIIVYLNTNSVRNKTALSGEVCRIATTDLLCIDGTKLDISFTDTQFHIEGYQHPPFRQGCDKNVGGEMIFIRESLIAKILSAYKVSTS